MNIPNHISLSLEMFVELKILQFFDADADPESGIFLILGGKIRIRDKHSGSATLHDTVPF